MAHWNHNDAQYLRLVSAESFKKEERLISNKLIDSLFKEGYQINIPSLKIFWKNLESDNCFPAQSAVAVSKQKFPRAHDRNKIKRLMRECYRKVKPHLYEYLIENNSRCIFMIIYTGRRIPEYSYLVGKFNLFFEQFKIVHETSQ